MKPKTKSKFPPTSGQRMAKGVALTLKQWHFALEDMVDSDSAEQSIAARLLQAADAAGLQPKDMIFFPHLLDKFELDVADISPVVIGIANTLDRQYMAGIQLAVGQINRMGDLLALQKKWEDSNVATIEEFVAMISPKAAKAPEAITSIQDAPAPSASAPIARQKIFGFPVTAVIRWMGQEHFSINDATKILKHLEVDVSPATIDIQLKAGRAPTQPRGAPAMLSDDHVNEICEILAKA